MARRRALLVAAAGALPAAAASAAAAACPSGLAIRGQCVPSGQSPLDFYLALPDDHYRYEGPMQTLKLSGAAVYGDTSSSSSSSRTVATAYVLNMTSQQWLTEEVFKPGSPSRSVWTHQLIVVLPRNLSSSLHTSWLWITGGSIPFKDIKATDSEVHAAARMALAAGTPAAVLKQVPNQPVEFATEIAHPADMYKDGRSEDGIIAYTWNHFVFSDPHSPEWLLRLPMTKAVARAMDTITDFVAKKAGVQVRDFVVGGASKRGWTTWTTGVSEPRCKAIVPVVMDLLNNSFGVQRHFQSLGGFTFEYDDYLAAGVVGDAMLLPSYVRMLDIVDPYSYFKPGSPWESRMFRNLPKMVVNGGNDEFFLPDDNHYWWDELPGEKHLLHIPDADHPLRFWPLPGNGSETFEAAAAAFYAAVVEDRPRPSFTWRISDDGAEITAGNFTEPPQALTVWASVTKDGYRDWRLSTCRGNGTKPPDPGNCTGEPQHHPVPYKAAAAQPAGPGLWRAAAPSVPSGQYAAFFLSAEFPGGFRFTTQVSIIPQAFPYPPCVGDACKRLV